MKRLGTIALLSASLCSIAAAQRAAPPKAAERTDSGVFPAGGTLRIAKSRGEVRIVGWDRPEFEVRTTVSPMPGALVTERPISAIPVTVSTQGSEVVVRTDLPRRIARWRSSYGIDYQIAVPQSARIVIEHHSGEGHLDGLTGDIQASIGSGLLALRLAPDSEPAVDAISRWGGVVSDFRGKPAGASECTIAPCNFATFPFGHRLEETVGLARQRLRLRAGYGDILILKAAYPH